MVQVKDLTELTLRDLWREVKDEEGWWGEVRGETLRVVKRLLEGAMEGELLEQLRAGRYRRSRFRRGYRNGCRRRDLLTELGLVEQLRVPRDREGEYKPTVIPRYQRRQEEVNRLVREMFLSGVSTRKVKEEERTAISRVLHDDTIQALTAVGHRIDALVAGYRELPKNVTVELELLANTVLDQADSLRRLCMGLRPAMLDRMGLGAAVEWLVRHACDGNVAEGTVRIDESLGRLNPNVEIRLFRIVQEAVNNAVRHAKARNIEVSVAVKDGHLELEVKDDGIGFDMGTYPTEHMGSEKLGLLGMRERARMLGAELDIRSEPGKGCRVFLCGSIERMEASV